MSYPTVPKTFLPWIFLTLVATVGLLLAERFDRQRYRIVFKSLAAFGFLGAAIGHHPTQSAHTLALTGGLTLSFIGDICLLVKGSGRAFRSGLLAFLLAHLAYTFAIVQLGIDWTTMIIATVFIALPLVWRIHLWLRPNVPISLKTHVFAYLIVISMMMACAIGAWGANKDLYILVCAASLFLVSDIGVAIQRFKHPRFAHKLWSLPTYFAAQLLFAYQIVTPV